MRLVLTGDIHLGRSSSRIPGSVGKEELRSVAAWFRIVDLAIREKADVVCLSGDIADQANKFWESIGPLTAGINRLAGRGILTVAVAGNHDYDVLPVLADQLPAEHFKLLGRDGNWERLTIRLESGEALNIDGWSFPAERVSACPLDTYDLKTDLHIPTLGLIHGDLDASSSPYAPLDLTRLQSLGSGNWLLGHIHAPRLIQKSSWVLYPGSPQALDPGEQGPHGPWMLEVKNGLIGLPVQVPVSSVWYDETSIDLTPVKTEDDLRISILESIQMLEADIIQKAGPSLLHTILRIDLRGHTPVSRFVNSIAGQLLSDLDFPSITVERIMNQTLPAVNLEEYAETGTAAGAVAKLLLQLEKDEISESVATLIRDASQRLKRQSKSGNYGLLSMREISEEDAREYLRISSRDLLTELVGQSDE